MSNIYDMADTWTVGATTYTAIKMNATDTASASASALIDLQVGGDSKFKVRKDGSLFLDSAARIYQYGGSSGRWVFTDPNDANVVWLQCHDTPFHIGMASTCALAWSESSDVAGTKDLWIYRDAANVLAQRNSTTAQALRLYNTWTDASNGEWLQAAWSGNLCTIKTAENGTGTHRDLAVVGVATPAGGSTSARLIFGTTAGFGIYYGSGAPSSLTAAQGSIYLRSDGSSTSTRLYVNTDGGTTWTNFTSAA
jgi:hypothetical protein